MEDLKKKKYKVAQQNGTIDVQCKNIVRTFALYISIIVKFVVSV